MRNPTAKDLKRLNVPIGTILAWHKNMPGTPPLPPEWMECNGQVVTDPESPYYGQTLPNLNGRFLRGDTTSGGTGGTETHRHRRSSTTNLGFASGTYLTTFEYHLPPYFNVVWIIKIK